MNKCPNNHCGERHSYVPWVSTSYHCEWCHQVQPNPEVEALRARVTELEAALKLALPILRYHVIEPASREIDRDTRRAFDVAAYALDRK